MRIRIDFKILIFLFLFYLTNQIKIYIMVMIFSFIHELGHIVAGLLLQMKPEKIEVMPCGLSASFKGNLNDLEHQVKNGNLLEVKKIFVALAGPLVSFILVVIYSKLTPSNINQNAVYSNLLIMLFNLIPIYPLDGGRIINGILHIQFGNKQAIRLTNKTSNITAIILTIISSIAVYYYKNISIFLICLFLLGLTIKENISYYSDWQQTNNKQQ